jgi:hypothetical protein
LLLGTPGSGKSKCLEYMIRRDLERRQPFCLIDLHGNLFRSVKNWCAYKGYFDRRVIIIDPAQGQYVKPYNPFRRREGTDLSVQVGTMVDAVLSVWGDADVGGYSNIFKLLSITFTVMIEKELSLLDGFALLAERDKMKKELATLHDPALEVLWTDLMKLPPTEWAKQISPTLTRLFRVIRSQTMQRFLCQMDNNLELTFEDTILVNLGKAGQLDHDAANVFAALLLNDFYRSAFRRKGKYGKDPAPYYVYIDEWWLLKSPDYERIMFESRKAGLLLVLANQDLSQIRKRMGSDFAESIFTLTQIKMIFGGINDEDVSRLARELRIDREVLRGLAKRQCVLQEPGQEPKVVNIPDVPDPRIMDSSVSAFEKRIAQKTNAIPIADIDRPRVMPQNEDTTDDGWAIQ